MSEFARSQAPPDEDEERRRLPRERPPTAADPDQIRQEIEATRADLSDNVNALADSVRPGNVVRRQVDKIKDGASDHLKDRVMGAAEDRPQVDPFAEDATGSAGQVTTRTRPTSMSLEKLGEQMEALGDLRAAGVLTEAEFATQMGRIALYGAVDFGIRPAPAPATIADRAEALRARLREQRSSLPHAV